MRTMRQLEISISDIFDYILGWHAKRSRRPSNGIGKYQPRVSKRRPFPPVPLPSIATDINTVESRRFLTSVVAPSSRPSCAERYSPGSACKSKRSYATSPASTLR